MRDDLTIVIPSHERHHLLDRVLPVLLDFDVPILLLDSSAKPYLAAQNIPSITYVHCPDLGFIEKMREHLPKCVSTPHVMVTADDIFPLKTAVLKALDFLKDNPDYSSAQGLTFYWRFGRFEQHRVGYELHQADSPQPSARLLQHYVYEASTVYCVQKTDCWITVLKHMPNVPLYPHLNEICLQMLSLLHGRAKRTGDIFHVIDDVPSVDPGKRGMTPLFRQNQFASGFELIKQVLSAYLEEQEPMQNISARRYIDSALSIYGVMHVDRRLYYWHDTYLGPQEHKTFAAKVIKEWKSFLGKTFLKKKKAERIAEKKRQLADETNAHLTTVLASSSPEIQAEFERIRKILTNA